MIIEKLTEDVLNDNYFNVLTTKASQLLANNLFVVSKTNPLSEKELQDLLRFADILSNSKKPVARNKAYSIITLLNYTYSTSPIYKTFSHSVLAKLGNFPGIEYLRENDANNSELPFERGIEKSIKEFIQAVPDGSGFIFTDAQYELYKQISDSKFFSFSGPTSMGKSFIIKSFIRKAIGNTPPENIVIMVPTRALIDAYKKAIPISDSLINNINKLKLCSTTWVEKYIGKEHLVVIDFFVTDATYRAFEYHFVDAFNLFKVFYELELLNLFLVGKDTRNLMLRVHKTYNFSDELPKPDPSRLAFRIEKIWINKTVDEKENTTRNIYYKALSDGEHQFNEVIGTILMMEDEGCLFLMDEPDTHFNPMWRAKLIKLLNYVSATNFEERDKFRVDENGKILLGENNEPLKEKYLFPTQVRNQEIIITTHSPFVISDSETQDVYKFEKINNQVHYDKPDIKTYGASVGLILESVFNRDISISDFSNEDLRLLKDSIKSPEDLQAVKRALSKFGESVEKFDAFSFLLSKEEEFKKEKKDDL